MIAGCLKTLDNQKIAYYHYKSGHKKVIVIAHGFYASKDSELFRSFSGSFLEEYDVFIFDFRGHGKSSDLFYWTSKEGEDLKAVLNHLKGAYEKMGLIGFSFGGSVSINTAAETGLIDSLICVSTASDAGKVDFNFWKLDWNEDIIYSLSEKGRKGKGVKPGPFWLKKEKPVKTVKKINVPVFYIHGSLDWVIKPWHSRKLYENTRSKKKIEIIKGGLHAEYLMRTHAGELLGLIKKWFKETL